MLNNVVLIGFMGSGKTSTGRILARAINSILIDIDSLIESNLGISINDVFNTFGEEYFRDYERHVCSFIRDNINNAVISTGGGTPMIYDVKKLGKVVYLDITLNDAISRVKNSKDRPKLKDDVYKLYDSRKEVYKKSADVVVESKNSLDSIVSDILMKLDIKKGLVDVCTS